MEVSSQMMHSNQYASIQPIQPEPKIQNLYEKSNGNAVNTDEGATLTPQGETNIASAQAQNTAEADALTQAENDAKRGNATDYLAHQSKQSQVEIYLSVATDNDDTASVIETLRDVQKQNEQVAAYATYQENQSPIS